MVQFLIFWRKICFRKFKDLRIFKTLKLFNILERMRQSIQEWTKQNLWKIAFKKFDEIWSTKAL